MTDPSAGYPLCGVDLDDEALRAHLVASRIAGDVATSRTSNTSNIDKFVVGHEDYHFGITKDRDWTYGSVLAVMAARVGIDPDAARRHGVDRIDPELVIRGLDEAAGVIAKAAGDRERVLFATGHPTGLLSMYLPVAAALASCGATLLTPADGRSMFPVHGRPTWIRYAGPVACLATGSDLIHSHRAEPMQAMLAALREGGESPPDLVVADHGWAGAAAAAGIATIGFADTNDPGVFIAAEQGLEIVAVPLDDNVAQTTSYAPLSARLLSRV